MEIEKDMDVEDSHILARQKSKQREILLDYDYKKCAGCSICVALCPKNALQEGPLQEIAKGLDAPPNGRRWLIYSLPPASQAELRRVQRLQVEGAPLLRQPAALPSSATPASTTSSASRLIAAQMRL